jgi:hypothetical protein
MGSPTGSTLPSNGNNPLLRTATYAPRRSHLTSAGPPQRYPNFDRHVDGPATQRCDLCNRANPARHQTEQMTRTEFWCPGGLFTEYEGQHRIASSSPSRAGASYHRPLARLHHSWAYLKRVPTWHCDCKSISKIETPIRKVYLHGSKTIPE